MVLSDGDSLLIFFKLSIDNKSADPDLHIVEGLIRNVRFMAMAKGPKQGESINLFLKCEQTLVWY